MDLTERLRASITQARAIDRSELLAEAADAIERLNKEVSILIAECQAMVDRCVNGPRGGHMPAGGTLCSDPSAYTAGIPASSESKLALTDAERAAVTEARDFYIGTRTGVALRGLLERLG